MNSGGARIICSVCLLFPSGTIGKLHVETVSVTIESHVAKPGVIFILNKAAVSGVPEESGDTR